LGIVVAWITWYFVVRLQTFSVWGLVGVIGAMIGGAALTYLAKYMKVDGAGFAWYAIGIFIGFFAYQVAFTVARGHPAESAPSPTPPVYQASPERSGHPLPRP